MVKLHGQCAERISSILQTGQCLRIDINTIGINVDPDIAFPAFSSFCVKFATRCTRNNMAIQKTA